MKITSHDTHEVHREYNDALKELLARFKTRLHPIEMLAITAHLVGVLIAIQDQTKITPKQAMEMVAKNIEQGNAEALAAMTPTQGNA